MNVDCESRPTSRHIAPTPASASPTQPTCLTMERRRVAEHAPRPRPTRSRRSSTHSTVGMRRSTPCVASRCRAATAAGPHARSPEAECLSSRGGTPARSRASSHRTATRSAHLKREAAERHPAPRLVLPTRLERRRRRRATGDLASRPWSPRRRRYVTSDQSVGKAPSELLAARSGVSKTPDIDRAMTGATGDDRPDSKS